MYSGNVIKKLYKKDRNCTKLGDLASGQDLRTPFAVNAVRNRVIVAVEVSCRLIKRTNLCHSFSFSADKAGKWRTSPAR
jgi:hypothetical protein